MRRPAAIWYLVLLLRIVPAPVRAQEQYRGGDFPSLPADTSVHVNTASILFDRNLNTYNWIGRAAIDTTAPGGMHVGLLQQYSSNVIEFQGASPLPKLQSGQENLSLALRAPAGASVGGVFQWTSFSYSDNKGTGLNNASSENVLGGVALAPLPWIALTPMAGYRWDDQAGIRDRGMTYMAEATVPTIDADGYLLSGSARFRQDNLAPRSLLGDFAHFSAEKVFSSYARDSMDVGVNRNRHEFYDPADSSIESRTEQIFTFADRLDYEVDPAVRSTFFVSIYGRGLDKDLRNWDAVAPPGGTFNTHIDEFLLDSWAQTGYRSADGRASAWIRLSYSERSEVHSAKEPGGASGELDSLWSEANAQEHINDNTARHTQLSGGATIPVSSSDRVELAGSVGILRYDTPSDLNVEDRDELLVALSLSTWHAVSRTLDLGIVLGGSIDHLVYLLSERSANNNINRVLRLSPRTIFRPAAGITSLNAFEVLANYTVYDFEQQLPSVKSFSYRQFAWMDSTSVDLTHRIGFDFFAYWRIYERGQLEWTQFREVLQNETSELTYAVQCRVTPAAGALFAVGLRYFGQTNYAYTQGVRQVDSFLNSIGPTCAIAWEPGSHSRLTFEGWYQRQRQTDGTLRSLSSITMNILVTL
ncbi:MAG TPA: hypothetical protein VL221_04385 [Bacteroidota bacterium]|nr:hypothetical protein [Bacteroidota bacterium]